jgi:hypothetical protein
MNTTPTPRKAHRPTTFLSKPADEYRAQYRIYVNNGNAAATFGMQQVDGDVRRSFTAALDPATARAIGEDLIARANEIEPPEDAHQPVHWFTVGTYPSCSCGYAPADNRALIAHWAEMGIRWIDNGGTLECRPIGRADAPTPEQIADGILDTYAADMLTPDEEPGFRRNVAAGNWRDALIEAAQIARGEVSL